jgi:hypothetical protein
MDAFLTVAEVAEILKLNQQTVRNWIFRTAFGVCPATTAFNGGASTDRPRAPASRNTDVRKRRTKGGGAVSAAMDGEFGAGR